MRYLDDQGGRVLLRDIQTHLIETKKLDIVGAKRITTLLKTNGLTVSTRDGKNFVHELTKDGEKFCDWLLENPAYGTSLRGIINIPAERSSDHPLGVVIESRLPVDEYRRLMKDKSLAPAFLPRGSDIYVRIDGELKEVPVR
jgi:hypothetical protein